MRHLWLPHFMSGSDVDYVYMVDTNEELLPDYWELIPASQAMISANLNM